MMVALFRYICQSFFFVMAVWAQHVSLGENTYRLVDSAASRGRPNVGRVQVQTGNGWVDVCDLDWRISGRESNLISFCRQLGFPGALLSREKQCNSCGYTYCSGHMYVEAACAAPGYYGCINELHGRTFRLLPDHPLNQVGRPFLSDDNMTVQKCIDICRSLGVDIKYAGLQTSTQCFCGIKEREQLFRSYKVADSVCTYPCSGDELEICGGEFKTSVYDITLGNCDTPSIPVNGSRMGSYTFDFGSEVFFNCNSGLFLHGSPSLQCVLGPNPNETMWNATTPTCEVFDKMTEQPGIEKATVTTLLTTTPVFTMGEDYPYSTGISIGASIGCVIFLTVTILISFYIFKRCKKRQDPTISYQNDSEVYVIPNQSFEHPKRNDDMQQESVYIGLDSSQQQTLEYQDLTNPDALKAEDDYLCLDTKSREMVQEYQDLARPDVLKNEDDYLGLEAKSCQTEPEYQYLTNPDELKTADDYLSLDADSRQVDQEYQDVNYKPSLAGDKEDNRDLGRKHSPCVPIPPQVEVLAYSGGPYVNVKELKK